MKIKVMVETQVGAIVTRQSATFEIKIDEKPVELGLLIGTALIPLSKKVPE